MGRIAFVSVWIGFIILTASIIQINVGFQYTLCKIPLSASYVGT